MPAKPVALVTGVSSGIGRAVAESLVAAGYRTYGSIRTAEGPLPNGVEALTFDVRDQISIASAIDRMLGEAGRIDVVVNNAGGGLSGAVEETEIAQGQALFEINFFGAARVTQAVLPRMRAQKSGRIIFISSVLGFVPGPYFAYYAASKHAMEAYAESLDHEVRAFGVRALLVEPSFMKTKINASGVLAARPLDAYAETRERVMQGVKAAVLAGDDPTVVAAKVVEAARAKAPRLRYPVGKGANALAAMRRWMPARMMDQGLRKNFRLDG
jgi:NAD(P)-dependent dehydrogenase (short-subunit alcohol dehydrogenase family)